MILCTHSVDEKTEAQKGDTVILDIHRTGSTTQIFRIYVYAKRKTLGLRTSRFAASMSESYNLTICKMDVKIAKLKML